MSVRKRSWTTRGGEPREAWVLFYRDAEGTRCQETFDRKKDADARQDAVRSELRQGVHIAPSKSPTIATAAASWLRAAEASGLEQSTLAQYRQHAELHIVPLIGGMKLAEVNAQRVRALEDDGRRLDSATAMRLFELPANKNGAADLGSTEALTSIIETERKTILDEMAARQAAWFDDEMDKLDNWAEDKRAALKADLKELDDQIKALKKEIRQTGNLPEKLALQRQARPLSARLGVSCRNVEQPIISDLHQVLMGMSPPCSASASARAIAA